MSNPPPSPPSEHHLLIVKKFRKCLHYEEQLPPGTGGVSNLDLPAGVSFDCSRCHPARAFSQELFLLLCLAPKALLSPRPHCPRPF